MAVMVRMFMVRGRGAREWLRFLGSSPVWLFLELAYFLKDESDFLEDHSYELEGYENGCHDGEHLGHVTSFRLHKYYNPTNGYIQVYAPIFMWVLPHHAWTPYECATSHAGRNIFKGIEFDTF